MSLAPDRVSVIVPAWNAEPYLDALEAAFRGQTAPPGEILLVDDGSTDRTAELAAHSFRVIRLGENQGPAAARNAGMAAARGDILAFTDCDCRPRPDWVQTICRRFDEPAARVLMGRTLTLPSNYFGDSVSCLGFPGGGRLGFERTWRVSARGTTDHISSCNFAARAATLRACGGFDTGFRRTYGEDAELAWRLVQGHTPILFCPEMVVEHPAMRSLRAFVRNQLARGRGNYRFRRKVGRVGGFVRLRLWSTGNIVRAFWADRKFPLILTLLALSFALQQIGYLQEARGARARPRA